jgi:hypothetical protein
MRETLYLKELDTGGTHTHTHTHTHTLTHAIHIHILYNEVGNADAMPTHVFLLHLTYQLLPQWTIGG